MLTATEGCETIISHDLSALVKCDRVVEGNL